MKKLVAASVALVLLGACGVETPGAPPTTLPTTSPSQVIPGSATGPTAIAFVSADPPPGTAVSGCGSDASGCPGRVRMVFRLTPTATGTAQHFVVTLHAASKRACFQANTGPLTVRANEATSLQVVLDPSDACVVPFTVTDLAANLEGTVELASRQEWEIGYTFAP